MLDFKFSVLNVRFASLLLKGFITNFRVKLFRWSWTKSVSKQTMQICNDIPICEHYTFNCSRHELAIDERNTSFLPRVVSGEDKISTQDKRRHKKASFVLEITREKTDCLRRILYLNRTEKLAGVKHLWNYSPSLINIKSRRQEDMKRLVW